MVAPGWGRRHQLRDGDAVMWMAAPTEGRQHGYMPTGMGAWGLAHEDCDARIIVREDGNLGSSNQ